MEPQRVWKLFVAVCIIAASFHYGEASPSGRITKYFEKGQSTRRQVTQDDLVKAQEAVKVLEVIADISSHNTLFTALTMFAKAGPAFTLLGASLGLVDKILPNENHEAIMGEFFKLHNTLDTIRTDIKELENLITWEATKLQYADVVRHITAGVRLTTEIANSRNDSAREEREKFRFKALCNNQECSLAITTLFDGVLGTDDFTNNILDNFYKQTGGDRPKMISLCTRLLQLLTGGVATLMTYEAIVHEKPETMEQEGHNAAEDIEPRMTELMTKATQSIRKMVNKCTNQFQVNMKNDLERIVTEGGTNKEISQNLFDFMVPKYDWLDLATIVYNDMEGFDKHTITGSRVESLHFKEKNTIIYFKEKVASQQDMVKATQVVDIALHDIIISGGVANAKAYHDIIAGDLNDNHIGYWGLQVNQHKLDQPFHFTYPDRQFTTDWTHRFTGEEPGNKNADYIILLT